MKSVKLLAIETGAGNGSLSIFADGKEIDSWAGEGNCSHSKEMVNIIHSLLARNSLKLNDLTHIAACEGPGSYTGLRVGFSIVKAFSMCCRIPVVAVSAFEAMNRAIKGEMARKALLLIGRDSFCQADFQSREDILLPAASDLSVVGMEGLLISIKNSGNPLLICDRPAAEKIGEYIDTNLEVAPRNLSTYVAEGAFLRIRNGNLPSSQALPLYARTNL